MLFDFFSKCYYVDVDTIESDLQKLKFSLSQLDISYKNSSKKEGRKLFKNPLALAPHSSIVPLTTESDKDMAERVLAEISDKSNKKLGQRTIALNLD
jgi:hypothetical protein